MPCILLVQSTFTATLVYRFIYTRNFARRLVPPYFFCLRILNKVYYFSCHMCVVFTGTRIFFSNFFFPRNLTFPNVLEHELDLRVYWKLRFCL